MSTYYYYYFKNSNTNDWQRIKHVVEPFTLTLSLDETLDSGKCRLPNTLLQEEIAPFSMLKVEPHVGDVIDKPMYLLVMDDLVVQKCVATQIQSALFDHEISVVELTKLLEREPCDTLTFTNPIGHDYSSIKLKANPEVVFIDELVYGKIIYNVNFNLYQKVGSELVIPCLNDAIRFTDSKIYWGQDGGVRIKVYTNGSLSATSNNTGIPINLLIKDGCNYEIRYEGRAIKEPQKSLVNIIKYNIVGVNDITATAPYMISDVIERILSVGVARRSNNSPKYTLDPTIKARYASVPAPEFHITRSTLFEALLQVGSYVHAIPRLTVTDYNESPSIITFDELGGSEEYTVPEYALDTNVANIHGWNSDEYCGAIDSIVENIVNTRDIDQGSVIEPSSNAYMTTRAEESEIKINNDTAIIVTEKPIYRVIKLEMGYIDNNQIVGDITPFLFEKAEYDTLSNYSDIYPYSKAYALTYAQGDNKITGLAHKIQDILSPALQNPAIKNIVEKIGLRVNTPFKNLSFRVTYIPIVTARLKQLKPYEGIPSDNVLIYNQGANTVESTFYGENMKGAVAKMGNKVYKNTYYFNSLDDVPKCGQLFNGRYISGIDLEIFVEKMRCTITSTPFFNKLSAYLGLNSNFRLYDVSEKQSVDRHINYGNTVRIGYTSPDTMGHIVDSDGINTFARTFTQPDNNTEEINSCVVQCRNKNGTGDGKSILRSAASFGFGNSLAFVFDFRDNFGAGYSSAEARKSSGGSDVVDSNQNSQSIVRYCDNFGKIYALELSYISKTKDTNFADQQTNGWCDNLPIVPWEYFYANTKLHIDDQNPLVVDKDSRERLIVTTQLHFVANKESIVIGSSLAQNNRLVAHGNTAKRAKIAFFPYKLNMLNDTVDLTNAAIVGEANSSNITVNNYSQQICLKAIVNNTANEYKSVGYYDPTTLKLYVGENMNVAPGAATHDIYFTF